MRIALGIAALIAWCSLSASAAQNVTVIGPITPGNCAFFNSTTVLKDAGFACNGAPGNAITALTGDGTATGPGSVPFTLATVTANVGAFGSATQCVTVTNNAKGLTTAISATTCTPALGSITGFGTGVATALANNLNATGGPISPAPTRAGDIIYWNGSNWVTLAGNNSGTQTLTENASGVPSWSAAGSGTVTSVACAGTTITTTGTCYSAGQIVGEPSNAAATAGNFGEEFDQAASSVALTTATPANITSKSIAAGDWELSANVQFSGAGGTSTTDVQASIGTVSATLNSVIGTSAHWRGASTADLNFPANIGPIRVSLAGATTYFCVAQATFATSTFTASCNLHARRAR